MIEIEGLTRSYGREGAVVEVLRGISLRVDRGEFVAVMGPSGTGKSTLMNILGLLDRPTSGSYRLDGADTAALGDDEASALRNRKIGFVFQQFHLLDRATALRNVMLPLVYGDAAAPDAADRALKCLEAVGLSDRAKHRPGELSGGQQQRVAIARALVTDPALLLADEPTGNLDVRTGLEILAILQKLHRQGRTVVMITHDAAVAEHAGRVVRMADGRFAEDRRVASPRDAESELRAAPSASPVS